MVTLKEKEICPKSDTCIFANVDGQKCFGCVERFSSFLCELDFLIEENVQNQACQV